MAAPTKEALVLAAQAVEDEASVQQNAAVLISDPIARRASLALAASLRDVAASLRDRAVAPSSAPLWTGPCATCGLRGESSNATSCPRCRARQLRENAEFEHLRGNHPTAADMLAEAAKLQAEVSALAKDGVR